LTISSHLLTYLFSYQTTLFTQSDVELSHTNSRWTFYSEDCNCYSYQYIFNKQYYYRLVSNLDRI